MTWLDRTSTNTNQLQQKLTQSSQTGTVIDICHQSHNASDTYPTMQHFVTEMCTHVHISVTICCIVGCRTIALWDSCNRSTAHTLYGYSCLSPGIIKVTRYDRRWGGSRDIFMMTSSNGNIFRVTGHLCGEVTGEFPTPRPVTHSFDLFFDLRLYKQLSKQSWGWWFETSSRPLWRHCNVFGKFPCLMPQQKKLFICKLCSGKSTWTKWFFSNYDYKDTTCFIFSLDWHQPNGRGYELSDRSQSYIETAIGM